jgi:peptidoglycan/LPS O-acetylase OafA/YrhL
LRIGASDEKAIGTESGATQASAARGKREYVPALDGFRALALLGVVTVHLLGFAGVFARYEGTDTDIVLWSFLGNTIDAFFIISAFVLFLPVVNRGGEFGDRRSFWVGRAARLFPAFWLVLAITAFLITVKPPTPDYASPTIVELLAHVTSMQLPAQLFDQSFRIGFGINGPLWILSIVVIFYAVLPFIARSWYRHPWIGLALTAVLTVAWKQTVDWAPGVFEAVSNGTPEFVANIAVDQAPGWAFSFGLGLTGAWAFVRARERWSTEQLRRGALIAAPFVLIGYGIVAWQYGRFSLTVPGNIGPEARADTVHALAHSAFRAALMGVVILGPLWLQRPFANRATRKLSEYSYGVYLIHMVLVIYATVYLDMPTDGTLWAFAAWVALIVPPSFVFAVLSRRFVEVPARRWIEHRFRRSRVRATPAEAAAPP